jgi:activator of 2-hydroxyglutaryl-CoA dehydratase
MFSTNCWTELKIQTDAVDRIVATGYGRNSVDLADKP